MVPTFKLGIESPSNRSTMTLINESQTEPDALDRITGFITLFIFLSFGIGLFLGISLGERNAAARAEVKTEASTK